MPSNRTGKRPPIKGVKRTVAFGLVSLLGLGIAGSAVWLHLRDGEGDAIDRFARTMQLKSEANRYQWKSIDKKHWQAQTSDPPEETRVTDDRERNRGACAPGMVEVKGKHRLDSFGTDRSGEIEGLQNKTCTNWISRDFPARCAEFDRTAWLDLSAKLPTRDMRYCMDRFEYPNVMGQNPVIVVTYTEAAALCKASSKRLCTETEWTFACEGEEAMPYPTGYVRDAEACVVDQPWRPFAEGALSPRDGDQARAELDRLWQGRPSGSHPKCRSPFGVYDLTGNVDEWTKTVRTEGYASVLKGGYWGPVRARCRPATRAHDESFVAYQQGFRCCADAPASAAPPAEPAPVPPAPTVNGTAPAPAEELDAGVPEVDGGALNHETGDAGRATPSIPTSFSQLFNAGMDAGALEPEDYQDEGETLAKRKKAVGCGSNVAPDASTGGELLLVLGGMVLLFRRKRRG